MVKFLLKAETNLMNHTNINYEPPGYEGKNSLNLLNVWMKLNYTGPGYELVDESRL